jgi:uncharacterized secreted protein with C-terminal beta-propeller domain
MAMTTRRLSFCLLSTLTALVLTGCTQDSAISSGTDTTTSTDTKTDTWTSILTLTSTSSQTFTATDTVTVATASTGTTTDTSTGTSTGTDTSILTGIKTSTVTATVTTTPAPNGYTLVVKTMPPLWNCPATIGTGGTGGSPMPYGSGGMGGGPGGAAGAVAPNLADSNCASLADLRRPALKQESKDQLERTRSSLVATNCQKQTTTFCLDPKGNLTTSYSCGYAYGSMDAGAWGGYGGASSMPGSGGSAGSTGATQYSTTNTQVASVDEADYVKNDNNTAFVLSSDGLHVIDAWPAAQMHEVAYVTVPGEPRRLFLYNNRLVVFTRMQSSTHTGAGSSNPSDQGCTYGYNCRFSSEGGHTLVLVYDVTNPATPQELARYEMSGGYVASRRIGSVVYTVVHDSGAPQIPGLDYTLPAASYESMQTLYAQRVASNEAKIDGTREDYFLPWLESTKPGAKPVPVTSCTKAYASIGAQGRSFVSVNAFDLTTLGDASRTVIASNAGYVYASPTALYMAVDRQPELDYTTRYGYGYASPALDTAVHKFKLSGTTTSYAGSVVLPGHILNQFAMDEDSGVLRVASTKGYVPDPSTVSYITTFGETAGQLGQLGQVGGIGPDEDIRSVRFDGDRGYVVTFKKTDPLFVFDLTDATKPAMLGELKIPGFSTYMQRLDATHLLAIGFTADDHESFAFFNGIQIQIFDVTDLANPKLAWKKVIGTRGSSSEALTNHLAFNYFAPKKMLAIPMTICEGGGDGVFGQNLTFAGLMAFDISIETGIAEHGRLPFMDPVTGTATDSCDKWWTDTKSLVKRSIFMDDFVYGLSDAEMRAAGLSSMSTVLATVPLTH